jgi:hypothetical protein
MRVRLEGADHQFSVGGFDKSALLTELARNRIELNDAVHRSTV